MYYNDDLETTRLISISVILAQFITKKAQYPNLSYQRRWYPGDVAFRTVERLIMAEIASHCNKGFQ